MPISHHLTTLRIKNSLPILGLMNCYLVAETLKGQIKGRVFLFSSRAYVHSTQENSFVSMLYLPY